MPLGNPRVEALAGIVSALQAAQVVPVAALTVQLQVAAAVAAEVAAQVKAAKALIAVKALPKAAAAVATAAAVMMSSTSGQRVGRRRRPKRKIEISRKTRMVGRRKR